MREFKLFKVSAGLFGGALLTVLLAGQAFSAVIPFQARPAGKLTTGYIDVKNDAKHYTVIYSAADEAQAKKFVELRAAQIGQGAGFTHFIFEDGGTRTLTITERYLQNNFGILDSGTNRDGSPRNPMDLVPKAYPGPQSKFYDVWGKFTFLTADEARGQPKAVQISQVLAAQGK